MISQSSPVKIVNDLAMYCLYILLIKTGTETYSFLIITFFFADCRYFFNMN